MKFEKKIIVISRQPQWLKIENKGQYSSKRPYSVANANVDFDKNMLLLKTPQISPNHYETLTQ